MKMSSVSEKVSCPCPMCNGRKVSRYYCHKHMDNVRSSTGESMGILSSSLSGVDCTLSILDATTSGMDYAFSSSGVCDARKRSISCLEEQITEDLEILNSDEQSTSTSNPYLEIESAELTEEVKSALIELSSISYT